MPSCSKAPRGLFVLSRVTCIFTGIAISPSPLSRQCPSRYAFRAGRNLPDKEFRYLRTVIVTAAVYRGFSSKLITSPFNLPALGRRQPLYIRLRVEQRPVFLVNSRLGLVTAAPPCRSRHARLHGRAPLLPKLRGEFAEFLDKGSLDRLGILYPPTSVGLRYGHQHVNAPPGFSRQCGLKDSTHPSVSSVPSLPHPWDFPHGRLATTGHGPCPVGPLSLPCCVPRVLGAGGNGI